MARQTILFLVVLALGLCHFLTLQLAQAQDQLPPPGTAVEVLDGAGRVQAAEFVEKTLTGLIKVKMATGATLTFPANRVRIAGGVVVPPTTTTPAKPKMSKLRTWTDATGMFKVEAEFLGINEGKVELKKVDGKTISLPLDKLAAADQDIAKFLAETNNPFEADVKDVTENVGFQIAAWPRMRETTLDVDQFPLVNFDNVSPNLPWRGALEPAAPATQPVTSRAVSLPQYPADSFWTHIEMTIDESHRWAWIYQGNSRSTFALRGENPLYLADRVDLRTGQLQTRIQFAQRDAPLAVDPTGQLLVTLGDEGRFHVWKIGDKLTPVSSFVIGKGFFPIAREPGDVEAIFIDTDHLQLRTSSGILTVRLSDMRPLYRFSAKHRMLGPSRKQTVVADPPNGLFLVDSISGRVIGRFHGFDAPDQRIGAIANPAKRFVDSTNLHRVAFTPDGTQLVQVDSAEIRFFDMQSGLQIKVIGSTVPSTLRYTKGNDSRVSWGPSGCLIVDSRLAIHAASGAVVAKVTNDLVLARSGAGAEWLLSKADIRDVLKLTLQSCTLPNEEMLRRAGQSRTSLAMAPGTKVAIVFDPGGTPINEADQALVRAAVEVKLKTMGLTLATAEDLPDHFVKFMQIDDGPAYLQIGNLRKDEFYWYTAAPQLKAGASESPRVNGFLRAVEQIPPEVRKARFGGAIVDVSVNADGLLIQEN